MEYTPGGGYQHSRANQLIFNFKNPRAARRYIDESIGQFVEDASLIVDGLIKNSPNIKIGLTFIPTSKTENSEEHNPNLKVVC